MAFDFINRCYEEEKELYNQLIALQNYIIARGGTPRISLSNMGESYSIISAFDKIQEDEYSRDLPWVEKTVLVLKKCNGGANPGQIVNWIHEKEPKTPLLIIRNNVYNSLSILNKQDKVKKLKSNGTNTYFLM